MRVRSRSPRPRTSCCARAGPSSRCADAPRAGAHAAARGRCARCATRSSQARVGERDYGRGRARRVEHYGGGQTLLGGDAFVALWFSQRVGFELAVGLRHGLTQDAEHGAIESRALTRHADLAFALLAARRRARARRQARRRARQRAHARRGGRRRAGRRGRRGRRARARLGLTLAMRRGRRSRCGVEAGAGGRCAASRPPTTARS